MVKLFCAIVGVEGSVFSVVIGEGQTVEELKKAIKERNDDKINVSWLGLQLFLAKKAKGDGDWLTEKDVQEGVYDMSDLQMLRAARAKLRLVKLSDNDVNEEQKVEGGKSVNVLVVLPGLTTTIKVNERENNALTDELAYYQRIGQEIQSNCQQHCGPILDKIDSIYEKKPYPMPFICVQGSSGMGKSQLAFALGGEGREHPRPWFYWTHGTVSDYDQRIYRNFASIGSAFDSVVWKDEVRKEEEDDILNCTSVLYMTKKLWTYGFIIELLRYCSRSNVGAQMVRVENQTFYVTKSNLEDVIEVRSRMEKNGEVLPFFILDEMPPSRTKKLSAFQLNVFRACGLVVIGMGTDANISNLVGKPEHSRTDPHWWMTVVSCFPPWQSIPFGDPAKEEVWQKVIELHPVVKHIAEHSRGLFSRCFVDAVVKFAMEEVSENETFALADLLDAAFKAVYAELRITKGFMFTEEGRDAQLMALSYTIGSNKPPGTKRPVTDSDSTSEPTPKRRKLDVDVGVASMRAHFANSGYEGIADVDVLQGDLRFRDTSDAWSPICQFPAIEKDVLLYLAVLGGKKFSDYNDTSSTLDVFEEFLERNGNREESNALRRDFTNFIKFENVVAHALFCASRRNGARGIALYEFLSGLVSEFQDEYYQRDEFDASALLKEFDGLKEKFAEKKIPFLAPPNARWPDYILEAGGDCNFGHFERMDGYVMVPGVDGPLFACDCQYWKDDLDSDAMKKIIAGLNGGATGCGDDQQKPKWSNWSLALVFCRKLEEFESEQREDWEFPSTGIATVDCKAWEVNWISKPEAGEKLVIVVQTGRVLCLP
eukprot:jgi/Phyca11/106668/e_gw1.12.123.1